MYLGECSKCRAPFFARSGTAEMCTSCRLGARIAFGEKDGKPKRWTCSTCGDKYAPLHSHDTAWCGSCEAAHRTYEILVHCGICKLTEEKKAQAAGLKKADAKPVAPKHAVYPGVPLCTSCVKSPKTRKSVQKALMIGFTARKEKMADPEARKQARYALVDQHESLAAAWQLVSDADAAFRAAKKEKKARTPAPVEWIEGI